MEQDLRDEGAAAKAQHVVHVLPSNDPRVAAIVRAHVERIETDETQEPALRLLVLVPTAEEAGMLAGAVNDGLDATGALLTPISDSPRGARRAAGARAAVTTPAMARRLRGQSALKLESVDTVVLLALDTLVATYEAPLAEVLAELPKGAARVASASELTPELEAWLELNARRARRMQYDAPAVSEAPLQYVVCDHAARARVLASLLDAFDPEHATVVAAEEDAEVACSALAHLGYSPEDALVAFSDGDLPDQEHLVILYTPPADAAELELVRESSPRRVVVLVAPEQLGAFLRVFSHATTAALPVPAVAAATSVLEGLRQAARQVLDAGTPLHHQLIALAPLFEGWDAAQVAAALLRILETRGTGTAPRGAAAQPTRDDRTAPRARERTDRPERTERPVREASEPAAAPAGTFSSIYLSVGEKDGARKGDLVGAITNEAGISSEMLGKITMRDMFSLVEVDTSVAARVIEALTGKVIRGRVINAREDKKPEGSERGERPARRSFGDRGARGDDRPRGGGSRERSFGGGSRGGPRREGGFGGGARREGGFGGGARREGGFGGGARREGGFGGGARREGGAGGGARREGGFGGGPRREGSGGGFAKRPSRDGAPDRPRGRREDGDAPRPFRDDTNARGPRAIGESREWSDRGERLRNARRPRRDND